MAGVFGSEFIGAKVEMVRRILGILLFAVACAAHASPTLLVVGDSISAGYGLDNGQGWVALLATRMARDFPRWRVDNASVSGDTTAGGLTRLPALLRERRPAVVIVELGGNDALRGLALARTRDNLTRMIELARRAGARTLLVGMQIPPNYGPVYTQRFAALYPEVARATGSALVPFLLAGIAEHRDAFQPDGIHPTAAAQPALLANVWPRLTPLLRAAAAERAR
jgi:acyl-CoA thioesterase-1